MEKTMPLSDFDREHLGSILDGNGDWFTAQLMRLIAKADKENLAKLALTFPEEVHTYLDWARRDES
jgi:hypothetical protein